MYAIIVTANQMQKRGDVSASRALRLPLEEDSLMKSIPPIPTHRQCKKCCESKPLEDFCRAPKGKYGRESECRECKKIRRLEYNNANRDKIREADANRSPESRAKKSAHERAKYRSDGGQKRDKCLQHARKNPDYYRVQYRKWSRENPDKARVKEHRRRARVAGTGGCFTDKDIAIMNFIQQGHCAYCYRLGESLHIDHIIPIVQGGPSDPWNLCLACPKCNSSKGGRTLEQWANRWYLPITKKKVAAR
jgi:5-methylcytosine-specific restriction endonuclease McrA